MNSIPGIDVANRMRGMVVKYRPGGTTLSIQRTYFEKYLTVSAISNIASANRGWLPVCTVIVTVLHLHLLAPPSGFPFQLQRYGRLTRESITFKRPDLQLQRYAPPSGQPALADNPHLQAALANRHQPTIHTSKQPVAGSILAHRSAPRTSSRSPSDTDSSDSLHLQASSRLVSVKLLIHNPAPALTSHNMLTYTEYYQTTTSPLGVGPAQDLAYQTIYDYFAEETAAPILLGRLLDLFEPEAVGALGIFLTDTFGRARLRLVHGLRKYPGPLTAPSTNKGKAFGYLDDIEGDAGELVLVDAALLEQAAETLVLSLDRHLDVIKHARHSHMIPMVLGDDPHMEVITPYKACFIPSQLVPLLLGKGLTAGTGPTIADVGVHFATPGTPFRGEPGLTLYMQNQVLYRDFPGLKRPSHPGQQPAPGQPAGADPTLAATLTALANQQLKLSEGLD
eukprot:jgi/Psemu1/717/gm1.717_g